MHRRTLLGSLGPRLRLASVAGGRLVTPELLHRARALGIGISVNGTGREDFEPGESNPGPWRATLAGGAVAVMTTRAGELLSLLGR